MYFREYEKIILIFRDPISRAMSPSNKLKRGLHFTEQKINDEYFAKDFIQDLKHQMPAWKNWYEKILQIDAKFCLLTYEKLKINIIEELKPAVQFLGYEINAELEQCILKNQEGDFHRPEKSKDEINKILSFIPPGDLETYFKMKEDVFQMLKNVTSC